MKTFSRIFEYINSKPMTKDILRYPKSKAQIKKHNKQTLSFRKINVHRIHLLIVFHLRFPT